MLRLVKSTLRIVDAEAEEYYTLRNRTEDYVSPGAEFQNRFPNRIERRTDVLLIFGPLHGERLEGTDDKTADHGITMDELYEIAEEEMNVRMPPNPNFIRIAIIRVPKQLPEGVTKQQYLENLRFPGFIKIYYGKQSEFGNMENAFYRRLPTEEIAEIKGIMEPFQTPEGRLRILPPNYPRFAPELPLVFI